MSSAATPQRALIEAVRRAFHRFGVDFRRHDPNPPSHIQKPEVFKALVALRYGYERTGQCDDESRFLDFCATHLSVSQAQLLQDLFVLFQFNMKRGGYFVEFGATDGATISNTVLLEREFGWTGVLAEPARYWHEQLRKNRNCIICTECVWHTTGQSLAFRETDDREYSTLDAISSDDYHRDARVGGLQYEVTTVSLLDLLVRNAAPTTIDYLSIDTEGSEFEILNAFDFGRYDVRLITVEHNFSANRERIHALLAHHGFERKFEAFSTFDDWYLRSPPAGALT